MNAPPLDMHMQTPHPAHQVSPANPLKKNSNIAIFFNHLGLA